MKDKKQLQEFVANSPDPWIQDAIYKAEQHIDNATKIACSISGGFHWRVVGGESDSSLL